MLGFGSKKKKEVPAAPPIEPGEGQMPDFSEQERKVLASAGLKPEDVAIAMESPNNTEEAYARILEKLTFDDEKYINLLTEFNTREIALASILKARAEIFDDSYLRNFLLHNMRIRVSKDRKGRTEIIKLAGAIREQEMKKNLWSRMKMMAGGDRSAV